MKIGKFVKGAFKPMQPSQYLAPQALSVHNQIYELRVKTLPISVDAEEPIAYNLFCCLQVPGATVIAVEAKGDAVRMQVRANQFQWAALIAMLPSLIGPILILIIGAIFIFTVPSWALAAIPLGIGGGIFIYALTKGKSSESKKKVS